MDYRVGGTNIVRYSPIESLDKMKLTFPRKYGYRIVYRGPRRKKPYGGRYSFTHKADAHGFTVYKMNPKTK